MSTGVVISGSGVYTPAQAISNEELCVAFNEYVRRENARRADDIAGGRAQPLQESSPEFIFKASGIRQRYVMDRSGLLDPERMFPNIPNRPDDQMSIQCEMALAAATQALAAAGRRGDEVDCIILAASNLQRLYPAIAMELQAALGAGGYGYDVSVGCSSATFGVQLAVDAIRNGNATCALVVDPELTSPHMNFKDRDSHFIFGDAATALVVEPADRCRGASAFEILGTKLYSKFSNNIRNNGGYLNRCDPATQFAADKLFYQQGRKVFKDIVPLVPQFVLAHLDQLGIKTDDLSRLWLHQANSNMNELIAKRLLGRPVAPSEAPLILDRYANTASSGSLIAFHFHHDDLPAGALGIMCSFGAGYSIGNVVLRRR